MVVGWARRAASIAESWLAEYQLWVIWPCCSLGGAPSHPFPGNGAGNLGAGHHSLSLPAACQPAVSHPSGSPRLSSLLWVSRGYVHILLPFLVPAVLSTWGGVRRCVTLQVTTVVSVTTERDASWGQGLPHHEKLPLFSVSAVGLVAATSDHPFLAAGSGFRCLGSCPASLAPQSCP